MAIEHADIAAGEIHRVCNFTYADAAARTGATVAASDVGKFAKQSDDGSVWELTDDSPVTWAQVAPGSGALQAPSGVNDANGNEVVKFGSTASAVNEVTVTNKATGAAPTIQASGGDTDIDLSLMAKGAGKVKFGTAGLKLPNADGSNGHVLKTDGSGNLSFAAASAVSSGSPFRLVVAVSDETTAITTGTAKVTFRMPAAVTLTAVRASLSTASTSGAPAVDVNEGGASIFSTTLTIDANEKTSTTAATPAVLSDTSIADDAEITIDIDTAGTGAKGLKVTFIGTYT